MAGPTYDRMAPVYEKLADWYSFGCLDKIEQRQLDFIEPGMRVLYAGIGPGSDAILAAKKGALVTGIDLSAKMIDIASRRFAAAGLGADLVHGDLLAHETDTPYDMVVSSFFIDCFDEETRPKVIEGMTAVLKPGGLLQLADSGLPRGSAISRMFWRLYHGIAYLTTWIQGITPWLPILDLSAYLSDAGLDLEDQTLYEGWRGGPVLFESVVGAKPLAEID